MRRVQAFSHCTQDVDDLAPAPRLLLDPIAQRLAAHVFHRDEQLVVEQADLEHGDDVGVCELRHRERFAIEPIVVCPVTMQLEGDVAT